MGIELKPLILANGTIGTPGGSMQLVGIFTPTEFGMTPPWKIHKAWLWVYQQGSGAGQNAAGNDTWAYTDTCINNINGQSNAAAIVAIQKLTPHNPYDFPDAWCDGQNFSAFKDRDYGDNYVTADWVQLWTQPQAGTTCYIYFQIDVEMGVSGILGPMMHPPNFIGRRPAWVGEINKDGP